MLKKQRRKRRNGKKKKRNTKGSLAVALEVDILKALFQDLKMVSV